MYGQHRGMRNNSSNESIKFKKIYNSSTISNKPCEECGGTVVIYDGMAFMGELSFKRKIFTCTICGIEIAR